MFSDPVIGGVGLDRNQNIFNQRIAGGPDAPIADHVNPKLVPFGNAQDFPFDRAGIAVDEYSKQFRPQTGLELTSVSYFPSSFAAAPSCSIAA